MDEKTPADLPDRKPAARRFLMRSSKERTRLWENQPRPKRADTEVDRKIQVQTGAPSVSVNRIVEDVAEEILELEDGEEGKPN